MRCVAWSVCGCKERMKPQASLTGGWLFSKRRQVFWGMNCVAAGYWGGLRTAQGHTTAFFVCRVAVKFLCEGALSVEEQAIRALLEQVKRDALSVEEALERLAILPYASLGESRVDHHRALRRGFPEVIFAQGKTPEQVATIFAHLSAHHTVVLATRADATQAEAVRALVADVVYDAASRCLYRITEEIADRGQGEVLILAAGTADLPVAHEAEVTLRLMGNRVSMLSDIGVAGLHRLLAEIERIRRADVLIVVAGMEGALPSVVAGLVNRPVIAVPTSIGYGVGMGGIAALLSMLTSCAAGITVVNIDNGFGAAYAASLINRRRTEKGTSDVVAL